MTKKKLAAKKKAASKKKPAAKNRTPAAKKKPAAKKTPAAKTKTPSAKTKTPSAKKKTLAAKTNRTPASTEFGPVFQRLRAVLARHVAGYRVKHDGPGSYDVDTTLTYRGRPFFFGAVRQGKAYVSYHLFPVYVFPDLLLGASDALKRRMQGKACFNFKAVDEAVFDELSALTARGRKAFESRPLPG